MELPMKLPALVRQRALANGVAGQAWLDGLAEVVAALAEGWGLELGDALGGGTASYVVGATDRSGRACVLKVGMPLDLDDAEAFARSVRVHQLAQGRGCAELVEHDASAPAMLLERLGQYLDERAMPYVGFWNATAATSRGFWRPLAVDVGLPTGADKAAWRAQYIATTWAVLGRPCGRAVIDRASALCDK